MKKYLPLVLTFTFIICDPVYKIQDKLISNYMKFEEPRKETELIGLLDHSKAIKEEDYKYFESEERF